MIAVYRTGCPRVHFFAAGAGVEVIAESEEEGGQLDEHEAGLIRGEAAVAIKRAFDTRFASGEALSVSAKQ
jgi:hypothetical protein